MQKILLNNIEYKITEENLPCLVTYGEKMGGSHLSITLIVDLFLQGSKILFLTAYPMARENFLEQIGGENSNIVFVNNVEDLENSKDKQMIIVDSGNESLFLSVAKNLSDLNKRVVFIKNIEIFSQILIDTCLTLENIILSGDIDKCVDKEKISKKIYKTIIAFNKTEIELPIIVPVLEKYSGFLSSSIIDGVVTIQNTKVK